MFPRKQRDYSVAGKLLPAFLQTVPRSASKSTSNIALSTLACEVLVSVRSISHYVAPCKSEGRDILVSGESLCLCFRAT